MPHFSRFLREMGTCERDRRTWTFSAGLTVSSPLLFSSLGLWSSRKQACRLPQHQSGLEHDTRSRWATGVSRSTSASSALKASRASSDCDICTVVSGGSTN